MKPRSKYRAQPEAQLHKTPVDLRSAHQIRISDAMKMIWKRRKREHPERDLQIAVAAYLRLALKPPTIWTAFPAGGGGKVRGAQLKAMGLMPGWPDIIVIHPGEGVHSGYYCIVAGIELKAAKGRVSREQEVMQERFSDANAGTAICRSIDDVVEWLGLKEIPLHAKVTT